MLHSILSKDNDNNNENNRKIAATRKNPTIAFVLFFFCNYSTFATQKLPNIPKQY
jgi:hypothetical protein